MKYYSEKTEKLYDSKKDLDAAEKEFDEVELKAKQKKEERAARAKEVNAAYDAYLEAYKKYQEVLKEFIKDYGSYHHSITTVDDLFDYYFKFPF